FTVRLTSQPTASVTIGLSVDDSTEGSVLSPGLSFTAANWSTAQVVTLQGADDAINDGPIVYHVHLAPAASADPRYDSIDPPDVPVPTQDDAPNRASVLDPIPDVSVDEGTDVVVDVRARDPDLGQSIRHRLGPGAPDGMTIDPATGHLTWRAGDGPA